MTVARHRIADTLDRAQLCFESSIDPNAPNFREASGWFIHHVTTAVLLEHIRRLDPDLADRLSPWLLGEDGIFSDGYAGELLHEWRQQIASGQPLYPIAPDEERIA